MASRKPFFSQIPKGYVVHHLDYDKTNDDISNLALMYKFHHVAHHWKQKKGIAKLEINDKELPDDLTKYSPKKMPFKYFHKPARRYYVGFQETDENGQSVQRRVWRRNGRPILTEEEADKLRHEIWNLKLSTS